MTKYICVRCHKETPRFYTMGDAIYENPPNFCMACIHAWSDFRWKFYNGRSDSNELWEKAMNEFIGKNWKRHVKCHVEPERVVFT